MPLVVAYRILLLSSLSQCSGLTPELSVIINRDHKLIRMEI